MRQNAWYMNTNVFWLRRKNSFAQWRSTVSSAKSKILGTKALKKIASWKQLRPCGLSKKKAADINTE